MTLRCQSAISRLDCQCRDLRWTQDSDIHCSRLFTRHAGSAPFFPFSPRPRDFSTAITTPESPCVRLSVATLGVSDHCIARVPGQTRRHGLCGSSPTQNPLPLSYPTADGPSVPGVWSTTLNCDMCGSWPKLRSCACSYAVGDDDASSRRRDPKGWITLPNQQPVRVPSRLGASSHARHAASARALGDAAIK